MVRSVLRFRISRIKGDDLGGFGETVGALCMLVPSLPKLERKAVTSRVPCNVTTFQLERVFTPLDLHSLKTRTGKIMFCFRVHILTMTKFGSACWV